MDNGAVLYHKYSTCGKVTLQRISNGVVRANQGTEHIRVGDEAQALPAGAVTAPHSGCPAVRPWQATCTVSLYFHTPIRHLDM